MYFFSNFHQEGFEVFQNLHSIQLNPKIKIPQNPPFARTQPETNNNTANALANVYRKEKNSFLLVRNLTQNSHRKFSLTAALSRETLKRLLTLCRLLKTTASERASTREKNHRTHERERGKKE
jgi:hypothetical protein